MPASRAIHLPISSSRWLLPAVIGVLSLLAGDRAGAAMATVTVSASHVFDAQAHRHECRCDTCRGESCCCGRDRSDPKPEAGSGVVPGTRPTLTGAGPCLSSAPCGEGSGLPDSSTGESAGKAVQATAGVLSQAAGGRLLPLLPSEPLPLRDPSRLEEPPELIG